MSKLRSAFVLIIVLAIITGNVAYAQDQAFEQIEPITIPITEALTTFLNRLAESTPNVIAAVILLTIGLVAGKAIGRIVKKVASKILEKTQLEKGTSDLNIEEIAGKRVDSPGLIAATVRWFIYLFFIVAAVNALHFDELSDALTALWLWVPNILAFILIVLIGFIIVGFVARWIDQQLETKQLTTYRYVSIPVKVVMYSVIFAVALTQLGIGDTIIPILVSAFSWSIAIAIGVSIAIGLGFAMKDLLPALISGASHQRLVLKEGQKVRIGLDPPITGKVESVELLHVALRNDNNETVIIPTKELIGKIITIITPEEKRA